ncbi:unnamed protein product, partial [Porites evermanni]
VVYSLKYSPWIFSVCFGENAAKKKKRSCPFSSSKSRAKKKSKSETTKAHFISKRSGSRSWIFRKAKMLQLLRSSASRFKIRLEEPDEESQLSSSTPSADGTWKTISGRAIVSTEKLLEKLDESVSCRFCQGRVQVMENVATKHGLGSTWRIQSENESCPSHKTNSVLNSSEKSRAFEINRASVLGLQVISGGHSAASKFFSFLCLAPINKNSWADHTKKIEGEAKLLLEKELNRAS